jgi:FSR family fosmidomycin resistance protein-like MFS transporter
MVNEKVLTSCGIDPKKYSGFAFGMGGIGSAALGRLADLRGLDYVFHVCSFLPLLGLLTAFLPDPRRNAVEA